MKLLHNTTSQSCSCTSCLFRSESEHPSLRRVLAHGSRIDKLYYGKYIPLREGKLLHKLVTTRAEYDDLKNQLISRSNLSINDNNNLHLRNTESYDMERSSAILELVNLVDKGVALGPRKISDCCSCCNCGSKIHFDESMLKVHRHPHNRAYVSSKTSLYSRKIKGAHRRIGKRVWLKAKQIKSDPCTCTFKFSGLMKKMPKRMRPKRQESVFESNDLDEELHKMRSADKRSITKVQQSKTKIKDNIEASAKKSMEKIKDAKNRLQQNVVRGVHNSIQRIKYFNEQQKRMNDEVKFKFRKDSLTKYRDQFKRRQLLKDWECDFECDPEECNPEECLEIKKRQRIKKLKLKRTRDQAEKNINKLADTISSSDAHIQTYYKKGGGKLQNLEGEIRNTEYGKYNLKPTFSLDLGPKESKKVQKDLTPKKNINSKNVCKCKNEGSYTLNKTKSVKTITSSYNTRKHAITSYRHQRRKRNEQNSGEKMSKEGEVNETPSRQAVRVSSSFSFNIEFYKNKPGINISNQKRRRHNRGFSSMAKYTHRKSNTSQSSAKKSQSGGYALKRCFCTLKLRSRKSKVKNENNVSNNSTVHSSQTNFPFSPYNLLPYECEPMMCIPGKCMPEECEIRIRNRNLKQHTMRTNTNYRMKSTPSLTSKSTNRLHTKNVQVVDNNISQNNVEKLRRHPIRDNLYEPGVPRRQAVRIGSTFSFNIEFSKGNTPANGTEKLLNVQSNSNNINRIRKVKKKKLIGGKKRNVHQKFSQISGSSKSRFTMTTHKLRRCFCTLKLGKTGRNKSYAKLQQTDMLTSPSSAPVRDIATITCQCKGLKNYQHLNKNLLPYECEPGICTPGFCDPYVCLEVIKRRQRSAQSQKTYPKRRTKSTSSLTQKNDSPKTKQVQSYLATYKKTITKNPKQNNVVPGSKKQIVKIGSSFSFNVEFFKDCNDKVYNSEPQVNNSHKVHKSEPRTSPKNHRKRIKTREKHLQKGVKTISRSTLMQKKERNALIGTALKRCLCTLKFNKPGKNKFQGIPVGVGAEKMKEQIKQHPGIKMVSKGTKAKKNNYLQTLLPYECEPYTCIPGECDPYHCLEVIKKRRLKNIAVDTGRVRLRSISSITSNSSDTLKSIYVQSNIKGYPEFKKKHKPRTNRTASPDDFRLNIQQQQSAQQAVRLRSNFDFNIEFYKNRNPDSTLNNNNSLSKDIGKKNWGQSPKIKFSNKISDGLSTHMTRSHKALGMRPMLKRCFCTLKLPIHNLKQKTYNRYGTHFQPTVMPVQIHTLSRMTIVGIQKNNNSLFMKKYLTKTRFSRYHMSNDYKNFEIGKSNIISESKIQSKNIKSRFHTLTHTASEMIYTKSSPIETLFHSKMKCIAKDKKIEYTSISSMSSFKSVSSFIFARSPFSNKRFYTMNLQVARERNFKYTHELEPYECEPGICVPGKCDPIVCQKRIMKSLMKRVSTMTGATTQSRSSSIDTMIKYRNQSSSILSYTPRATKVNIKGLKFKTTPKTHKQAVRIGSTFSFNIDFSKNRSLGYDGDNNKNRNPILNTQRTNYKNIGTKGQYGNRYDRMSQSIASSQHKATGISPKMNRCFCTLKFQKRGKQQKKIDVSQSTITPVRGLSDASTSTVGKNTKLYKQPRNPLDPYECEPGICIPGECNPFDCLKLIKKRNRDYGTNFTPFQRISTPSMTTSIKKKSGKRKTIQTNGLNFSSREKIKSFEHPIRSSRQAVRLGSSFSFNVEFYKDKEPELNKVNKLDISIQDSKHRIQQKIPKNKFSEQSTQDIRLLRDQNSQTKGESNVKSTEKSNLFKRCFCTAKLGSITKPQRNDLNSNKSPTFVNKCICALKSLVTLKKTRPIAVRTEQEALTQTDNIMIENVKRNIGHIPIAYNCQLPEPNECEPGFCVSGFCDPIVCERRIRMRNTKFNTKGSITESPQMKSSYAYNNNSVISQGTTALKPYSHNKNRSHSENDKIKQKQNHPLCGGKNVVRVGSNFSFNIEFYKDRFPQNDEVRNATEQITRYPRQKNKQAQQTLYKDKGKKITKDISADGRYMQTDAEKKKNRGSGMGHILKRCFCTLKLQKTDMKTSTPYLKNESGSFEQISMTRTQQNMTDKLKTHYKLEPYECEPNVCVPGECDPHECKKRILNRNKGSGTSPKHRKTKSKVSSAKRTRKSKCEYVQTKMGRKPKKEIHTNTKNYTIDETTKDLPTRQAVQIGSNFSFNIDFFKSNNGFGNDVNLEQSKVRKESFKTRQPSQPANTPKYASTKSQQFKRFRHVDSQVLSPAVKSTFTKTEIKPFLKRCFCTLQLQKPKPQIIVTNSVSTATHGKLKRLPKSGFIDDSVVQKTKYGKNLLPNECEPGVCVPGMCDPHECLKGIQKRVNVQSKSSGTTNLKEQGTASMGYVQQNTRAKKNQVNFSHKQNDYGIYGIKNSAKTPQNRQALRIGSSFSFGIDFYKDKSPQRIHIDPYRSVEKVKKHKIKENKINKKLNTYNRNKFRDGESQSIALKMDSRASGVENLLKRCFCTLTLHETNINKLHPMVNKPQGIKLTQHKSTSTKRKISFDLDPNECEPGVCVPGQCNPYDCLERVKQRQITRKSRETGTSFRQNSRLSVATGTKSKSSSRGQGTQSTMISKQSDHSRFVEQPRFAFNNTNKQAVRVSSNFSFNIEFYKNNMHMVGNETIKHNKLKDIDTERKKNRCNNAKCINTLCEKKDATSQSNHLRTKDKSSTVGNVLKRCFCTEKLQNIDIHRPNVVAVCRANDIKTTSPFYPTDFYVQYQRHAINKSCCPCTRTNLGENIKNVAKRNRATKINNEYLKSPPLEEIQITSKHKRKKIKVNDYNDMETILPYAPRKFHKNTSKTLLHASKNMLPDNCCTCICTLKGSKRLSSKRNMKLKPQAENKIKPSSKPPKIGYFAKLLKKKEKNPQRNNLHKDSVSAACACKVDIENVILKNKKAGKLKVSKSERQPKALEIPNLPKQSKSLKTANVSEKPKAQKQNYKFSRYQGGDNLVTENVDKKPNMIANELTKCSCRIKTKEKKKRKVQFSKPTKTTINNAVAYVYTNKPIDICVHENKVTTTQKSKHSIIHGPLKKLFEKGKTKNQDSDPLPDISCLPYWEIALTKDDKKNKIFDHRENCKSLPCSTNIKKCLYCSKKINMADNMASSRDGTVLQNRQIKSDMNKLVGTIKKDNTYVPQSRNTRQVYENEDQEDTCAEKEKKIMKRKRKHNTRRPTKGLIISIEPKVQMLAEIKTDKAFDKTKNKKQIAPCICGSKTCRKDSKKKTKPTPKIMKKKQKPCICGSPICARESAKATYQNQKITKDMCLCPKTVKKAELYQGTKSKQKSKRKQLYAERNKNKLKLLKKDKKEQLMYQKKIRQEDSIRRRLRQKEDQKMDKVAAQYKNTNDLLLIAESVFDLAKLGFTAAGDVSRSATRCITNPKGTYSTLKTCIKDPSRAGGIVKTAVSDSGVTTTLRRVGLRLCAISGVRKVKNILANYACTNYLLHMFDKDPSKRLLHKKKPKKKVREPLDFGCSPYMASLRKRPCLFVYYMCPWFYPHCLGMLKIWKQFTDIMVFLLALVVWSPCIFCWEICRAIMCCFVCTG